MSLDRRPEPVSFLSNEWGDDLIVSFAVDTDRPGEVVSVILLRTPKFEHLRVPSERGVRVSHDRYRDSDGEYLRRFALRNGVVEIVSTRRRYVLNVSRVDPGELEEAERILQQMNTDRSFELTVE
jgi:hypothetical protein